MEPIKIRDQRLITVWLFIGMVMVFFQIILGGVTRLTGSGLSITHWEIIMGIVPPLNAHHWQENFDLYKETPQYQHINKGMSIEQFKFIFYWEYFHRLWARVMGIVFAFPFFFFLLRKSFSRDILKRLFVIILLAGLAAAFGWIMVASGLINRPWVNAYKLTIHLILGILLFITLFFAWLYHRGFKRVPMDKFWRRGVIFLIILTSIQVAFGGFMSGMKSALNYPTWPLMNGAFVPAIILNTDYWNLNSFLLYDKSGFMPSFVQFIHRNMGYLIFIVSLIFSFRWFIDNNRKWRWISFTLFSIIVIQVSLGILTLIGSIGSVPVLYGSLHQGIGILFITFLVYLHVIIKKNNII